MLGFFNIDKPPGMTSHDVVARVRRAGRVWGVKKVGHAGTLDPMATGVLVVCIGAAARLSDYAMHAQKAYSGVVHFGIQTDSYDADGAITAQTSAYHITRADAEAAFAPMIGDVEQIPPMVSAIKQGGKKLYELARAGQTVERAPRRVYIDSITITDWSPPRVSIEVVCGAGTYIRSIAHDAGTALGVGAHLAALTRTASGAFRLSDAVALDTLIAAPNPGQYLIAPSTALPHLPSVQVDSEGVRAILQGKTARLAAVEPDAPDALIHDENGVLLALARLENGWAHPHKVFAKASDD